MDFYKETIEKTYGCGQQDYAFLGPYVMQASGKEERKDSKED